MTCDFIAAHMNLQWLRPESALCDAVASSLISRFALKGACPGSGCGNGLFSPVTSGGARIEDCDWVRDADPDQGDMYDVALRPSRPMWIARQPRYRIAIGFDAKETLLAQAASLGLYGGVQRGDANERLPFPDQGICCSRPE